jgi:hypothetical protein
MTNIIKITTKQGKNEDTVEKKVEKLDFWARHAIAPTILILNSPFSILHSKKCVFL